MQKIFLSLDSSKITYRRLHTNFTVIAEISSSSTFFFPVPFLPVYEYEVMNTVFLDSITTTIMTTWEIPKTPF